MTSPLPDAAGPVAGAAWHAGEDLLTGYATGTIEPVAVWSVEAHLTGCARCRSALSAQVDPQRLAANRSVLLVRAALGDGGRAGHPGAPLRRSRSSASPGRNAQLKNWRSMRKLRCCPWKAGQLAKAIHIPQERQCRG